MMKNRFSGIILLLSILCFMASSLQAKTAPNFIIFYVDDMSWYQTSFRMMDSEPESKHPFFETPHLEKLSKRGMRFSNGYSPAPTCTPSRVSIQFGQTPARTQYRFVHDIYAHEQRPNGYADEVTMGAMLKKANLNYKTAHFGKGAGSLVGKLNKLGYDVTDEYEKYGPNGNGHGDYQVVIGDRKKLPEDDPKRIYSLTKDAVKFINDHAGQQPFFMMVSHYACHSRKNALASDIDRFQKKYDALPNKPEDKVELKQYFERERDPTFAAMVNETDWSLGEMMKAVEAKGELDNTYIIFTADNGAEWVPFNKQKRRQSGPLQMGKYHAFEGGIRVPFVIAGPNVLKGAQCDVPVIQWDLLPTLHDLSGSKAPLNDKVDGGSLRDVLERGNDGKVTRKTPGSGLVFHFPSYYQIPVSVLRVGDYKFMRNMNSGETLLYNVATDYREKNDLSKAMPEKTSQMEKDLLDYIHKVNGADVQDIYGAYFRWIDNEENKYTKSYHKKVADLEAVNPADLDHKKAALLAQHEQKLRSCMVKREICKEQMKNKSWYEVIKNEVCIRLGIDKQGRYLKSKNE
jgi:arylsulfatase A-like enzyme